MPGHKGNGKPGSADKPSGVVPGLRYPPKQKIYAAIVLRNTSCSTFLKLTRPGPYFLTGTGVMNYEIARDLCAPANWNEFTNYLRTPKKKIFHFLIPLFSALSPGDNQRGVTKGIMSLEDLEGISMRARVKALKKKEAGSTGFTIVWMETHPVPAGNQIQAWLIRQSGIFRTFN